MAERPTAVPRQVLLFTTRLSAAMKSLRMYPSTSDIPGRTAHEALEALEKVLEEEVYLEFGVTRGGLVFAGSAVFPGSQHLQSFARELYLRNLATVRFDRGITPGEMLRFLELINTLPETLVAQGGIGYRLSESGIGCISVTEGATLIVDAVLPDDSGELVTPGPDEDPESPAPEDIGQLLTEAGAGQTRDRRVLMRVLRDRRAVAKYLRDAREHQPEESVEELARRVALIARVTHDDSLPERAEVVDVIAEAIMELDPTERGGLYESYLLEQGRLDDAIAATIERLGVDEVVDSILSQIEETSEALKGLSRAVRNLALMNVSAEKDTVLDLAVTKLRAKGFSEGFVQELGDKVAPSRMTGADQRPRAGSGPVETVLRLVDMAPDSSKAFAYDDSVEPLRAEAAGGMTDGDVILALVTLAALETREEEFLAIVSMLEDSVSVLVDVAEADVVADVAEALAAAAAVPEVSQEYRERMMGVVHSLAGPESLGRIMVALRSCRPGSAEYLAYRRLFDVLGESAVDPLLEILADERDMPARKMLVDLLSSKALDHIPKFGARLADHRWYFVRNIVSILASTRSPAALPFLERTLRHGDARVRRETIRGLSVIPGARAVSMLTAALDDADSRNVQAAVRCLGLVGAVSSVPALEQVALGTGAGDRTGAVRVEAIRALARLGSQTSVVLMRGLARKRRLFGSGPPREVREAALEALQALPEAVAESGVDS